MRVSGKAPRRKTRPSPGCPARDGNGTDISTAGFTFVVNDCGVMTEVFGYFRLPGDEHENDALVTGECEVPTDSPIARMACQVAGSPSRERTVEAKLRRNIADCSCTVSDECPALSVLRLVEAMERATGNSPRAGI